MPVKIARSTPQPSFGLPELLVASHISRLASRDAAKSLLSTLISESSGECRFSEDLVAAVQDQHLGGSDAIRQATQARQPQEIADIRDEPPSPVREIAMRAGFRARLTVPLLSINKVVGALVIRRKQPGDFP